VAARAGLPEVRYLQQARLGLSASRNLALRATGTELVALTDDDCVPEPGWLAAVTAAFERAPWPAAVTGRILPLGDPAAGTYALSSRESTVAVDYSQRTLPWLVGSGGNFAAPAEVLRRCGGWDERLGAGSPGRAAEDADILYRLLLAGQLVRYEPAAVVRHEQTTRARRLATRWSYGYGVGVMCGLWLARRDVYALRMLGGYARLHVRPLLGALRHRDRDRLAQHGRALAALAPGVLQGLRTPCQPAPTAPAVRP
jgi:GT2 family glycosyltransferase